MIIKTANKREVIDITDQVNRLIKKNGPKVGLCHLFLKHTTAALTTADLDPGTDLDMLDALEQLFPKLKYRHPHDPDHVTDHITSAVIGTSLTLAIAKSQLVLGTWQRVVLIELAGPRQREIVVSFGMIKSGIR